MIKEKCCFLVSFYFMLPFLESQYLHLQVDQQRASDLCICEHAHVLVVGIAVSVAFADPGACFSGDCQL